MPSENHPSEDAPDEIGQLELHPGDLRVLIKSLRGVRSGASFVINIGTLVIENATLTQEGHHVNSDNKSTVEVGSNSGSINVVQGSAHVNITNNIKNMERIGRPPDVAAALREITDAVINSPDLNESSRAKILDALSALSGEAVKEKPNRSEWSIKGVLQYLPQALSAVGTLSALWTRWGSTIATFFEDQSAT